MRRPPCPPLVVLLLAGATSAHAEPAIDPAAARAQDANLESTAHRRSIMVTVAGGGSMTFGFGVDDAVGRGGGGSLRLARVMTPRSLLTLELTGTASLHQEASNSEILTNTQSGLLLGAQYYVGPSFWIRGATGLGGYAPRHGDNMPERNRDLLGPAFLGGAGIDVARFRHVSIGFETYTLLLFNRDGAVATSAFSLNLSFF